MTTTTAQAAAPADEAPPAPDRSRLDPRALYKTHFAFVWRNLRRLGVPEKSAEDAAQDVFLVVHRRQDTYDSRWSRPETWLFGIVLRVASDYRRSQRRWSFRFDAQADPEACLDRQGGGPLQPDDELAQRDAIVLLEKALSTLDDAKRAVLVMVDLEEFSVPEAAASLGLNVNTAYWRLRAARQELSNAVSRLTGDGKAGTP